MSRDLSHLIDRYLAFIKNIEDRSKDTIKSYGYDLDLFQTFCIEQSISSIDKIDYNLLKLYLRALYERGVKRSTINRRISSLKSFFNYLYKSKIVDSNPTTHLIYPKKERKLPHYISVEKIDDLFKHLEALDFFTSREALIFELFYATGMRLSEANSLDLSDIVGRSMLRVYGKGGKFREVPISNQLIKAVNGYLPFREEILNRTFKSSDSLIISVRGESISNRQIQNIVKEGLERVGNLTKKSPHVLRHSFATHLLNNGADLMSIKELLGHRSLSATQVYTHSSIEQLRDIFKKAHPKGE